MTADARAGSADSPAEAAPLDCSSCGACRPHCAVLRRYGTPAEFLGGPAAERAAYACALCGLCREVCPAGADTPGAVREVRRRAFAARRHPAGRWAGRLLYEALGRSPPLRAWAIPEGCDTVLFPGCALAGTRPHVLGPLRAGLAAAEPGPPPGLVLDCCAALSRSLGDEDGFRAASRDLLRRLTARGVRRVLAACPTCLATFREALGPLEVASIYEVLARAPGPAAERARTLALHDPCATRWERGLHDAVRKLAEVAGVRVLESAESRERTRCCGGGEKGGGLATAGRPPGLPAEGLVTYCAGCARTLARLRPTLHLADLLYPGAGPAGSPGVLAQLWARWRLARRLRARGLASLA